MTEGDRVSASPENKVESVGKFIKEFLKVAGFKTARERTAILVECEVDIVADQVIKLGVAIDSPVLNADSGEGGVAEVSAACFDVSEVCEG